MDPINRPAQGSASDDGGGGEGIFMSEYDKRSVRLIAVLVLASAVLLVLMWKWGRELCRRKLGFGSKVFAARGKTARQERKKTD